MLHPYAHYLQRCARRYPDRLAVIDVRRDVHLTWTELLNRVAALAAHLAAAGVNAGDRVVLRQQNTHSYVEAACAIAWRGATVVPTLHTLTRTEFDHIVAEIGPTAVLNAADSFDDLIRSSTAIGPMDGPNETLSQIMFSSGSTGQPKGIMHSFASTAAAMAGWAELLHTSEGARILVTSPISHGAGRLVEAALINAQTVVILDTAKPAAVIDAVEGYRITHALVVPTVLQDFIDHPDLGGRDVSSLQMLIYAAAPASATLITRAYERLGAILHNVYGMSEAPTPITHLDSADHARAVEHEPHLLRSCGREYRFGVQTRLIDAEGNSVPDGEPGELAIAGPWAFVGYWNQPELYASRMRSGWMLTGDVARVEDGYFYLMDRRNDMIISGGFNVYPAEIENVISAHPAIREVVVVGEPHPRWGEAVLAVVSLCSAAEDHEIIDYCRKTLAAPKVPKRVLILDELPRSAHDKLSRRTVKDLVLQHPTTISGSG